MTSPNRDKENKPSKKTEWGEGVKFGIKKSHKTWMTRIKKMRKDYKDILHQRDNEIREKIQEMRSKIVMPRGIPLEEEDLTTREGAITYHEKMVKNAIEANGFYIGRNSALDDLLTYLSNREV